MGYLEGLLGGFLDRKGEVEQQNRAADLRQQQQEQGIFSALMNADDPDVRALALTGLLHSAEPRQKKSGLRGWMGEMQASPYFEQMRNLLATPVTEANPAAGGLPPGAAVPASGATLPSTQTSQGVGLPGVKPSILETPDANAPAAQSSTSLVEQKGQGAPPIPASLAAPSPTQVATVQPTSVASTTAPPVPYTVTHPRQAFLGPMDRYAQEAIAKAGADVEGDITAWMKMGLSRAQAIEQVRQERLRRGAGAGAGGVRSIAGEVPDGQGGWEPAYAFQDPVNKTYINADTGQPMPGFRPRTSVGSTSFGADRNAVARELFGVAPGQLNPSQMAQVDAEVQKRVVTQAGATTAARGAAENKTLTERWLTPEQASSMGVPFGTAMADLKGFTPLTEDQRKRKDALMALAPQVTAIEGLIKQVIPANVSALQASEVVGLKRARRDQQMAQLEGELNRAVGNIARVLAAESGRLTQQDVERASKSLADLQGWTDTQESALARLNDVQTAMDKVLADLRSGGEPALRSPSGPPPAPAQMTVPGLFVGPDGQLHTGSPSGPVYTPTGVAPAPTGGAPPVPFTPQAIRPVR